MGRISAAGSIAGSRDSGVLGGRIAARDLGRAGSRIVNVHGHGVWIASFVVLGGAILAVFP